MNFRTNAPIAAGWAAAALLTAPAGVLAHAGHGAAGDAHWHATDTLGLLLVAGGAVLAYWFSRGGR